jgi:hypothetical protein
MAIREGGLHCLVKTVHVCTHIYVVLLHEAQSPCEGLGLYEDSG